MDREEAIKEVNRLRKREYRKKTGLVIVEGYPEVSRAVKAKVPVRTLYICPEIFTPKDNEFEGLNIVEVSKEDFAAMAFGDRLKGILAICHPEVKKLADLDLGSNPLMIILENVEKPGNLGAVLRSSDGAGADAVIMCDAQTDIYNQHVVRSSIGTVFSVPTVSGSKEEVASFLNEKNIEILTTTSKATHVYTDTDLTKPLAIVVGNEHDGVSDFWQIHAKTQIKIPMLGQASSLNVTVSASIFLYEALRQRQKR